MDRAIHVSCHLIPLWDGIRRIRNTVDEALDRYPDEVRNASKMTASELMENAAKYGTSIDQDTGISFELTATDRLVTITVTNRLLNEQDGEDAIQHLDIIKASENSETLYLRRLQVLMDDMSLQKTQLGLYRIAYEGQFHLSYTCDHHLISITAVRSIASEQGGGEYE
ncbi:MAG: hypothetical protein GY801_26330 [bacterium]|nr:hypothetical protein [bacterium]